MEKKRFTFTNELLLIAVIACEIVLFGILNPRFLRPMVLLGSINDFISICIISLFVTMVIIAGGMDIQAGSIVGLTSIVIGVIFQSGVNVYVACLIAVAAGALCGLLSGFIIAYAKVPPMVVTLGGSFLYSGLAISITRIAKVELYKGISGFPSSFTAFTQFRFFGIIPSQILLFIAIAFIAYFILHRTKYGRYVYRESGFRQRAYASDHYGCRARRDGDHRRHGHDFGDGAVGARHRHHALRFIHGGIEHAVPRHTRRHTAAHHCRIPRSFRAGLFSETHCRKIHCCAKIIFRK